MGVGPRAGYVEIAPNVWRRRYERTNRNVLPDHKYYFMNDDGIRQNVGSEMKVLTEAEAQSALNPPTPAPSIPRSDGNITYHAAPVSPLEGSPLGYVLFPSNQAVRVVSIEGENITVAYRVHDMVETRSSKHFFMYPTRESALRVPFREGNFVVKMGYVRRIEGDSNNWYVWESGRKKTISPMYYRVYGSAEEAATGL